MYVLIVGGGKVGFYLARELLAQGHEVLVIERSEQRVQRIQEELGNVVILGDGCELSTMARAGASRCDVVVAVTGDDEDNLIACQVAKHQFGVSRSIARINNPENERIFRELGIDVPVSATNILMTVIEHEVPRQALLHLLSLRHMGLEILEVVLSPWDRGVGKRLSEMGLPKDCLVSLIVRNGSFIIPDGDTVLKAGDELIAMAKSEREEELRVCLLGPS